MNQHWHLFWPFPLLHCPGHFFILTMSSADEEPSRMPFVKKRRVAQRACDICRRRKIKCDEPKPPHNKCSNCFQQGVECTYIAAPKKRGRPKSDVEGLQSRISFLEGLVNKV
ncbi:hypothetical protein BDQ17DRAFT_1096678 [Cyathus striatus]|nr:hypothetical protein BDQ17DRAFT_1096678 [Cyathus striatus]